MIAERLKQIRLARGLSLDALVQEMGEIVTKQAISKYENGKAQPTPKVLRALARALKVPPTDLLRRPSVEVEFVAYRKGSGLRKKEQATVENVVERLLEQRLELGEMVGEVEAPDLPVKGWKVAEVDDAEKAAEGLRALWGLGLAPIASMVATLEDHRVHVVSIEAGEKFDGISAFTLDRKGKARGAAVVTRRGLVGERQRMNLAHELGHLVIEPVGDVDEEKAAFRFGSAFLVPAETLYREVGLKRNFVQGEELMMLKEKFGISVQALLYRLQALGVIGPAHYRQWCIAINQKGYRKDEPGALPTEEPVWLRRTVIRALSEGQITRRRAERILAEGEESVEWELPVELLERRELLKASAEERRSILAAQMAAMKR